MFTEYSFNIYNILLFSILQFFVHMSLSVNQMKQLESKKKKRERKLSKKKKKRKLA